MQIFYLDRDPTLAAQYLCDKHICKMILESAQLLCTTVNLYYDIETPYKVTHKNHPCAKWLRESSSNFEWLYIHSIAICEEYKLRYNKDIEHKSRAVIEWCFERTPPYYNGLTEPAQAMPDEYKYYDPVQAYRNYYWSKQEKFNMIWTKRYKPHWWLELERNAYASTI